MYFPEEVCCRSVCKPKFISSCKDNKWSEIRLNIICDPVQGKSLIEAVGCNYVQCPKSRPRYLLISPYSQGQMVKGNNSSNNNNNRAKGMLMYNSNNSRVMMRVMVTGNNKTARVSQKMEVRAKKIHMVKAKVATMATLLP